MWPRRSSNPYQADLTQSQQSIQLCALSRRLHRSRGIVVLLSPKCPTIRLPHALYEIVWFLTTMSRRISICGERPSCTGKYSDAAIIGPRKGQMTKQGNSTVLIRFGAQRSGSSRTSHPPPTFPHGQFPYNREGYRLLSHIASIERAEHCIQDSSHLFPAFRTSPSRDHRVSTHDRKSRPMQPYQSYTPYIQRTNTHRHSSRAAVQGATWPPDPPSRTDAR
ncbi:hypothetical protein ACRALDRAFT_208958 [Sodiomyces alcalophilus JCM 7366]|uniref:uncharacterized protein n=1 Tax=Sodiomyces alcalophilus JCM 7366 TaxID=591952 RepID=UPI0039B4DB74